MHHKTRNINTAFNELVQIFKRGQEDGAGGLVVEQNSRNGKVLRITEPVIVTYEKPLERILFNSTRDVNPFSLLYESLYMLAGRNDVAPLAYYTPKFMEYSDDGKTLNGAYGYRWRHAICGTEVFGNEFFRDRVDQLDILVRHLKTDPDSRRAVLQMWEVESDLLKIGKDECGNCFEGKSFLGKTVNNHKVYSGKEDCPACGGTGVNKGSKDVACNLSVLFSIRKWKGDKHKIQLDECLKNRERDPHNPNLITFKNYLDMTVYNRSNDLILGALGANYCTFSVVQEYMAARIGVKVGVYNQVSNNMHVYDWNWEPEKWLNAYDGRNPEDRYKGDVLDTTTEENKEWRTYVPFKHFPLVQNPEVFEEELPRFVESYSGDNPNRKTFTEYKEPFLLNVAQPMMRAFYQHKQRDYEQALRECASIQAEDWKLIATQWIRKRHQNWEKKNEAKSG